jgi:nucleoside-diphosphate-sugar epimerase
VHCPAGDCDTVDDKMKNIVDVRDVAEALIRVYETPEASGRYICRSYPMSMTEILDIINPKLSYPKK